MKAFVIALVLLLIIVLILIVVGILLVNYVTLPKRTSLEEAINYSKEHDYWKDFDSYEKETVEIKSYDGYMLHGMILKNEGKKFVIITHGYTDNRYGSVKYCHMYRDMGYQVLLYDLRHHGENESCYCSMGYKEHKDILAISKHLKEHYGNDITIGLHGESLGCASSILALGQSDTFDFCVADCGFSDLYKLLSYQAYQTFRLPAIFAHLASGICYIMHGHSFSEIRPIDSFLTSQTPILFLHGKEDDFIPPYMSMNMYDKAHSYKRIELVDFAKHARSYEILRNDYEAKVKQFLEEKPVLSH